MRAAILCPAVCISDVINKAKTCGKSINYVTNITWLRPEELQFEAKGLLPYYGGNKQMKPAGRWKYLQLFYVLRSSCVFGRVLHAPARSSVFSPRQYRSGDGDNPTTAAFASADQVKLLQLR